MSRQEPLEKPTLELDVPNGVFSNTFQDIFRYYQGEKIAPNYQYVCGFDCGLYDYKVFAWIVITPEQTYRLYHISDELETEEDKNKLFSIESDKLEPLYVYLCRYCLNNFVIEEDDEKIRYLTQPFVASQTDFVINFPAPKIDESEIPYDLIKYFDFTKENKEAKENE